MNRLRLFAPLLFLLSGISLPALAASTAAEKLIEHAEQAMARGDDREAEATVSRSEEHTSELQSRL